MKKLFLMFVATFLSFVVFSQTNQNGVKIKKNNEKVISKVVVKNNTKEANNENQKRLASSKIKKEKYLKLSDKEYRANNNIPSSFPIYTETGDVVKDTRNYDISVKDWIKNNENEYNKIKELINF